MYTPSIRPLKNTEVTTPGSNTDNTSWFTIRNWLLAWAFIRLVVSILWGGIIVIATVNYIEIFYGDDYHFRPQIEQYIRLGYVGTFVQVVEIGMLVTFITAGFKKSATLYRVYYYYCILTLIIYILAMLLCFSLDYSVGHWFGELYLTYHIPDFLWMVVNNGDAAAVIAVAAMIDICLEIWLIYVIKKLIKKYNYGDISNGEKV